LTRYTVVITEDAERDLQRLDRSVARRVVRAIEGLEEDALQKVRRLVNSPYYRLRVGDWRVIVDIDRNEVRVLVVKVAHRRSVYR
jgi:mRNA interferase RelE/StbE